MSASLPPSPLWIVHRITIGISALGAYVFAAWSLFRGFDRGATASFAIGAFALAVGLLLSVYLWRLGRSPKPPR